MLKTINFEHSSFIKWLKETTKFNKEKYAVKSEIMTKHTVYNKESGEIVDEVLEYGDTTFHKGT
jgi:hypothetical protein